MSGIRIRIEYYTAEVNCATAAPNIYDHNNIWTFLSISLLRFYYTTAVPVITRAAAAAAAVTGEYQHT